MPWTKIAVDHAVAQGAVGQDFAGKRPLTYGAALREAQAQALKRDARVFICGEGVDDPGGVFGSTQGLHREFPGRVFDTPIAENALTGIVTGAALSGMRPILVHMRLDFMLLSFDQILNHAAKLRFMSGGKVCVPWVVRALIGRGWGSAAQHSQSFYAMLMHMPGIKVVMPATAYDAKGLLLAAIADDDPVVCVEHRWLYETRDAVPEEEYFVPIGRGIVRREGQAATILAFSWMVVEALRAAETLAKEGIFVEVVDPRSLVPFDEDILIGSVQKTGRLVVADGAWESGSAAEIVLGRCLNRLRPHLKSDVAVVAFPDAPTPASPILEKSFYRSADDIVAAVRKVLSRSA